MCWPPSNVHLTTSVNTRFAQHAYSNAVCVLVHAVYGSSQSTSFVKFCFSYTLRLHTCTVPLHYQARNVQSYFMTLLLPELSMHMGGLLVCFHSAFLQALAIKFQYHSGITLNTSITTLTEQLCVHEQSMNHISMKKKKAGLDVVWEAFDQY